MQRVVRMDTERLQTRTLSAFDPSDPTEEENTDALSPQLKEIPREELACLKVGTTSSHLRRRLSTPRTQLSALSADAGQGRVW